MRPRLTCTGDVLFWIRRAPRREGVSERGWGPARDKKMFDYIISGIVAVLLLVYLGWAMFQPEKF